MSHALIHEESGLSGFRGGDVRGFWTIEGCEVKEVGVWLVLLVDVEERMFENGVSVWGQANALVNSPSFCLLFYFPCRQCGGSFLNGGGEEGLVMLGDGF